eukprot:Hpha_TRINITY_DN13161_c0_g1::TRINITY_DN13161_c0_g1_i1::g.113597::m.113597
MRPRSAPASVAEHQEAGGGTDGVSALERVVRRHDADRLASMAKDARQRHAADGRVGKGLSEKLAVIRERQQRRKVLHVECSSRCERLKEERRMERERQAEEKQSRREEAERWIGLQNRLRDEQRYRTRQRREDNAERQRRLQNEGRQALVELDAVTCGKVTDLLSLVERRRGLRRKEAAPFHGPAMVEPPGPVERGRVRRPQTARIIYRPESAREGAARGEAPTFYSFRVT